MDDPRNFRPDRRTTGWFFRWWFWLLLVLIVMSISIGVLGWVLGWISVPGRIVSPENVEEQWRFAYQYSESLESQALQVCAAEEVLAASTTDNERAQRRSHLLAMEQNYFRIQQEYDARLRNAFEAGLVAPPDVPRRAPSLEDTKTAICK